MADSFVDLDQGFCLHYVVIYSTPILFNPEKELESILDGSFFNDANHSIACSIMCCDDYCRHPADVCFFAGFHGRLLILTMMMPYVFSFFRSSLGILTVSD